VTLQQILPRLSLEDGRAILARVQEPETARTLGSSLQRPQIVLSAGVVLPEAAVATTGSLEEAPVQALA